jgi:hypothetical protein
MGNYYEFWTVETNATILGMIGVEKNQQVIGKNFKVIK